ncbi:MAG: DUF3313 family protein [Woeseiaceae bacterium]
MKKRFLILVLSLFGATSALAENNDFLTDYSNLENVEGGKFVEKLFLVPNAVQRLADYDSIMVDQPEIFIASDSKYKGAKGDQLKALADVARLSTIERLEAGGFNVVDQPGSDTLYMHWAITDLYLQKKKRGILSFTPVGMVVHATKGAATRDLWKKIDIAELSLEIEITDVVTGEVLAAAVTQQQGFRKQKGQKADIVSWQELDALFETVGERVRCNLSNAGRAEQGWQDCAAIWIEPEVAE